MPAMVRRKLRVDGPRTTNASTKSGMNENRERVLGLASELQQSSK